MAGGTPLIGHSGLGIREGIQGVVKRWSDENGYGFLRAVNPPDPGGADIFVGRAQLTGGHNLVEGGSVTFDTQPSPKRPGTLLAVNVTGAAVDQQGQSAALQIKGLQGGLVGHWNEEKGFGFIKAAIGGDDVFVRRDSFGGKGLLIEGLAVWFECTKNTGTRARGQHQLSAQHVSGPAVLHRAEEFKPGDLVVFREGTDTRQKNERGTEGAWYLGTGKVATVVDVQGDGLVLNNGKAKSDALHAAYWWRKTFIKVDVAAKGASIEKTLGLRLSSSLCIREVDRGGAGAAAGLREGETVRWVDGNEVLGDADAARAWGEAAPPFEVIVLLPCVTNTKHLSAARAIAASKDAAPSQRALALSMTASSMQKPAAATAPARDRRRSRERDRRDRGGGRRTRSRDRRRRSRSRDRRRRSRSRDRRRSRSRDRRRSRERGDAGPKAGGDAPAASGSDAEEGKSSGERKEKKRKKGKKERRRRGSSDGSQQRSATPAAPPAPAAIRSI